MSMTIIFHSLDGTERLVTEDSQNSTEFHYPEHKIFVSWRNQEYVILFKDGWMIREEKTL